MLKLVNCDDIRASFCYAMSNGVTHVLFRHGKKRFEDGSRAGLTRAGLEEARMLGEEADLFRRHEVAPNVSMIAHEIAGGNFMMFNLYNIGLFSSATGRNVQTVCALLPDLADHIEIQTPRILDMPYCGVKDADLDAAHELAEKLTTPDRKFTANDTWPYLEKNGYPRRGEHPFAYCQRLRVGFRTCWQELKTDDGRRPLMIFCGNSPQMNSVLDVAVDNPVPELTLMFLKYDEEHDMFTLIGMVTPQFEEVATPATIGA